ncbi:pilin [Streptomyces chrestomyceticus]|uniref:pilin n=1 Tax=Streptomyces chrestomyceticus TaxID=68185 RepID=UPI0033E73B2A
MPSGSRPHPSPRRCAVSRRSRRGRAVPRRRWWAVVGVLVAVAVLVAAAPGEQGRWVLALATVGQVLTNLRTWLMGILAGLATVFLTVGGVRYLLAGGDPGEVAKAKSAFRHAGLGYALAALAPIVVQVLKGIVGA